jgi:hypothetical protein
MASPLPCDQAAFPADAGGGWSRPIANTLGVPHSEVRRVIDEAAGRGQLSPALHSMLNQDQPIPRAVMSALTNHVVRPQGPRYDLFAS